MANFSFKAVVQRLIGRTATEKTAKATTTETKMNGDVNVEPQVPHTPEASKTIVDRYADDRISVMIALASRDYGWNDPDLQVKVMLVNADECAANPNFRIMPLVGAFSETGHSEWEFIMADFLMKAVVDAFQADKAEADISAMFNRTFLCRNGRTFTPEQVRKHLARWFETVEIAEGVERVRFTGNAA